MTYIGKSFQYEGNVDTTPFDEVEVTINIPIFEYEEAGQNIVQKGVSSHQRIQTATSLRADSYQIKYPPQAITGADKEIYLRFLVDAFKKRNLDDFAVGFQTSVLGEDDYNLIDKSTDALYIYEEIVFYLSNLINPPATHVPPPPQIPEFTDPIPINKENYIELLEELKSISGADNSFYSWIQVISAKRIKVSCLMPVNSSNTS